MNFLATVGTEYAGKVQFFNSEQTVEMLHAELYLFLGGFLFAFVLAAFSMIIRATKGASRDIDL